MNTDTRPALSPEFLASLRLTVTEVVTFAPLKCTVRDHGRDADAFGRDAEDTGKRGVLRAASAVTMHGTFTLGCCNWHRDEDECTAACHSPREAARQFYGL
jgi:hypothetical protein